MDRIEQMKLIQQEALERFIKKNGDYADAIASMGVFGCMEDKMKQLSKETMHDTLIDLHNYVSMAIMLDTFTYI